MMKFVLIPIIISVVLIAGSILLGVSYAAFEPADDIDVPNGKSVFFSDHAISVSRTNDSGDAPGNFLYLRGFDGIIMASAGTGDFGTGIEGLRVDSSGNLKMANTKSLSWVDEGISITRANTSGDDVGAFLQLRGFEGIVFRTLGTGFFGTGDEALRITSTGDLSMINGKSLKWIDNAVSFSRTNSDGDSIGNYLNLRGFEGIVLRTGGTGFFGTGDEQVRITSTGMGIGTTPIAPLDVNGDIRLTGNLISPNDICIGTCT